jgi:uncharacterized membrane protein YgdD (TMEM256/DUF423 family)
MNGRFWMSLGALLAGLGVVLGAYHAHGLQTWLQHTGAAPEQVAHRLDNAEVAVRYQMYHALGLIILGTILNKESRRMLLAACWLLGLGVLLFSGGLYLIVFTGNAIHWAIVPLGGVTLIAGWLVAAIGLALRPAGR